MHSSTMGQKKMPNQPLPADAAIGCRRTGVAWREKKDGRSRTYPNLALCVRNGRMLPSAARMPLNMMKTAISGVHAYKTSPMRLSWQHHGATEHRGIEHTCQDRMCRFGDDLMTACTLWNICNLIGTCMKTNIRNDQVCMKKLSILPTGGHPFRMSPNNLLLATFLPECMHPQTVCHHTHWPQWYPCERQPMLSKKCALSGKHGVFL